MQELVPHVSCFGTFLSRKFKDGDYITVGGKIIDHYTMPEIFEGKGTEEFVKLDDGSDFIRVFIFTKMIENEEILTPGNVILVTGRLNIIKRTIDFKPQVSVTGIKVEMLRDVIKQARKEEESDAISDD